MPTTTVESACLLCRQVRASVGRSRQYGYCARLGQPTGMNCIQGKRAEVKDVGETSRAGCGLLSTCCQPTVFLFRIESYTPLTDRRNEKKESTNLLYYTIQLPLLQNHSSSGLLLFSLYDYTVLSPPFSFIRALEKRFFGLVSAQNNQRKQWIGGPPVFFFCAF